MKTLRQIGIALLALALTSSSALAIGYGEGAGYGTSTGASSGGGGTTITSCSGDLTACTQTGAVLAATVVWANASAGTIPNAALVTAALTAASTLDATKLSGAIPTAVTGSPTLAVTNFTGVLPTALTGAPTIAATNITGAIPSAVTGTTQTTGDNSTKLATTAYADQALTGNVTKPAGSEVTTLASIPAISGLSLTALPALTGDVTSSGLATTSKLSANLQQPAMFIGSSAVKILAAAATTGTINTPSGTANGDLELVFIVLNNTTSSAFTPPAGWTAITSCNASGNTVQGQAFKHVASSEGGTIAAFTWTTNGTGMAWASSFRNVSGVDVCAAATAASATTLTTAGYTAVATSDLNVSVAAAPGVNAFLTYTGPGAPGQLTDFNAYSSTSGNALQVSYPITSTTVAGTGYTAQGAQVWVGFQLGLTYSSSTLAGVPGALTYNQYGASLNGLTLAPGYCVNGACYSLFLTGNSTLAQSGIAAIDAQGKVVNLFSAQGANGGTAGTNNLTIGDATANNNVGTAITIQKTLQVGADNSVKTLARLPFNFSIDQQTALVAAEHMGTYLTTQAITIENATVDETNVTCATPAVATCFDCGTSVGACTSGQTSTIWTSPNITTALTGTSVAGGSITTANVATAHYITCEVTAGTCATLQAVVSLIARPQ